MIKKLKVVKWKNKTWLFTATHEVLTLDLKELKAGGFDMWRSASPWEGWMVHNVAAEQKCILSLNHSVFHKAAVF